MRRLDLALLLVPFYLPFFPAPKLVGQLRFSPSEILIVLDVVVAVALLLSRRVSIRWNDVRQVPFLPPAVLLIVSGAVSTAAAADRHVALEWFRWTLLEPVLYFALLLCFLRQSRLWVYLAVSAALGGAVAGAIGIAQSLVATSGPRLPVLRIHLEQARGFYGSPDNLGLLDDRVVPLWLSLGLVTTGLRRGASIILGLVLTAALVLTYSRGAWVATGVAGLLLLAWTRHWGKWVVLVVLVAAIALGAVAGPRVAHALSFGHNGTASKRLVIWGAGARMIRDHPLLGIGPDNFQHYYAPTRAEDRWQTQCAPGAGYVGTDAHGEPCQSHPHNEVLDFWLSTGAVGVVAFIWIQIIFWRDVAVGIVVRDPLVLGVAAAMVASLIHGLVDNSYFLPDLAVLFWIMCAIARGRRLDLQGV